MKKALHKRYNMKLICFWQIKWLANHRSDVFLCEWWLFALMWSDPREDNLCAHRQVIWARRTCSSMESYFMLISVFCHSSVLYPGQMRGSAILGTASKVIPSSENSKNRPWLEENEESATSVVNKQLAGVEALPLSLSISQCYQNL